MPSINDFIDHRWTDAKEALRKLDEHFVSRLESEVRLRSAGLSAPWPSALDSPPKRRLPKHWHLLLEACLELTIQTSNLQVAATSLTVENLGSHSALEVGRRSNYHFRSWFVHAITLADQCKVVIARTARAYITDCTKVREVVNDRQEAVQEQIVRHLSEERNRYVQPGRGAWARGLTEDVLWESQVAAGMTPTRFLDEFHYPEEAPRAREGDFDPFVGATTTILERIGTILGDLEADIK